MSRVWCANYCYVWLREAFAFKKWNSAHVENAAASWYKWKMRRHANWRVHNAVMSQTWIACKIKISMLLVFLVNIHRPHLVQNVVFHLNFGPNCRAVQHGLCAIARIFVLTYLVTDRCERTPESGSWRVTKWSRGHSRWVTSRKVLRTSFGSVQSTK